MTQCCLDTDRSPSSHSALDSSLPSVYSRSTKGNSAPSSGTARALSRALRVLQLLLRRITEEVDVAYGAVNVRRDAQSAVFLAADGRRHNVVLGPKSVVHLHEIHALEAQKSD